MPGWARASCFASILACLAILACGDDTASPGRDEEPRTLRLEVPEFVSDGQPFALRVSAHGSDPSTPLASFSGTAALSVSGGTITPKNLQLSGGAAQVQATVSGAAGEVTVYATVAALESTASLRVLAPGQLLPGDPGGPAESAIPALPFTARAADYSDAHPDLPGIFLSFNTLVLAFEIGTTVGEANAVLGPLDAEIVGGIRGVAGQAAGILILRLASTEHEEMQVVLDELRSQPEVRAAAQDALLEPQAISGKNGGSPADWTWSSTPDGGNWGLELIRVPQIWNLIPAIDKGIPPGARTGVLDTGFTDPEEHPDLRYFQHLSPGSRHYHGAHVAGIIGATFNRGDGVTGIDGLNPFAKLVVKASEVDITGETRLARGASFGQGFVSELDALLRSQPDLRVLNISLAYPWKPPEVNTSTNEAAKDLVRAHGVLHKTLLDQLAAEGHTLPLIVTAAGNESESVAQEAKYSSPMNFAALELGVLNTIVVEALNRSSESPEGATRRPSSNHNGHLSAPGGAILSTLPSPVFYDTLSGTSMAAPHVAGLAGFLLAVDPSLTTANLWELLLTNTVPVAGGASPRVDAWAAVMDIDRLKGDSDVLRMLVDIDDGTVDGNLRVHPDDESGTDHTEDDADEDGGIGDGDVDMSDFRRWRDGYLALAYAGIDGAIVLDGSAAHPKRDLNGNGRTESEGDDESVYPFVDLNGDNLTDNSAADVPRLGNVTDLQVLQDLFDDPHYEKVDLDGLLLSADIAIRPAQLLDAGEAVDIHSSVRREGTEEAEDDPNFRRIHTGDEFDGEGLWQVYTVPAYESDGATERTWTARVVGVDAAGDTVFDAEREFTGKPGQDHFWDPDVGDFQCPAPPSWAVPEKVVEWGPFVYEDERGEYWDGIVERLDYDGIKLSAFSKAGIGLGWSPSVHPSAWAYDYIKIYPLDGWPADSVITLRVRQRARVSAELRAGDSESRRDDDDATIYVSLDFGGAFVSADATDNLGAVVIDQIDEVVAVSYRSSYDWWDFSSSIGGNMRTRGYQRSAHLEAEYDVKIVGAEDSGGNPLEVQVCSASGTQY